MPYAVRQWPAAPDPRSSDFSYQGWDWGQVVSWRWIISSTNATGPWAFLNDGFVCTATSDDGIDTEWTGTVPDSGGTTVTLRKLSHEPPIGSPLFSIEWLWIINVPSSGEEGQALEEYLYPDAIRVFGPTEMLDNLIPIPDLPDEVIITPAKWDFSLP